VTKSKPPVRREAATARAKKLKERRVTPVAKRPVDNSTVATGSAKLANMASANPSRTNGLKKAVAAKSVAASNTRSSAVKRDAQSSGHPGSAGKEGGPAAAPAVAEVEELRDSSVQIAVDILTEWRDVLAAADRRYSEAVFEKFEAAAMRSRLPNALVDATKSHLAQASKMQIEIIDRMISACHGELDEPGSPKVQDARESRQKTSPMPMKPAANFVTSPAQFWLEATSMWRKSWSDAMSPWVGQEARPYKGQ
jgi:hypothetical protein